MRYQRCVQSYALLAVVMNFFEKFISTFKLGRVAVGLRGKPLRDARKVQLKGISFARIAPKSGAQLYDLEISFGNTDNKG